MKFSEAAINSLRFPSFLRATALFAALFVANVDAQVRSVNTIHVFVLINKQNTIIDIVVLMILFFSCFGLLLHDTK